MLMLACVELDTFGCNFVADFRSSDSGMKKWLARELIDVWWVEAYLPFQRVPIAVKIPYGQ